MSCCVHGLHGKAIDSVQGKKYPLLCMHYHIHVDKKTILQKNMGIFFLNNSNKPNKENNSNEKD